MSFEEIMRQHWGLALLWITGVLLGTVVVVNRLVEVVTGWWGEG